METVCHGKRWDVLFAGNDGNGRPTGALPYLVGRKLGLTYILQPELTMYNGPWLADTLSPDGRMKALTDLANQLDSLHPALYMQKFHPSVTNWLPFYWKGFRQTTRYTYRLDPLPAPTVLRTMAAKERRKGTEAVEEAYTVDRQVGIEEFADFHTAYWERRSGYDLLGHDFIRRVCRTALDRGQALLYGLRDSQGTLMAARFVVFDSQCAYSLLSAIHPQALRNSMTFLVWSLVADLHGHTSAFDFEGSMDPGIGHFYRSFGSTMTPLLCVYRSRLPFAKKILKL